MSTGKKENERQLSNHEITKLRVMSGITEYDIPKAIRQFGLVSDVQYLYVDYMTRHYRIDKKSGMTEWSAYPWGGAADYASVYEAGFNEILTIFDVLFYSREDARLCGEYTLMQNLSQVQTGEIYAGKGGFQKYEKYWDGKEDLLSEGCRRLGGIPAGKGDVSYKIPVFQWTDPTQKKTALQQIDVILQFWRSDEEFPASFNFLFDKNLLQFMHYETTWYVISHLLSLLE